MFTNSHAPWYLEPFYHSQYLNTSTKNIFTFNFKPALSDWEHFDRYIFIGRFIWQLLFYRHLKSTLLVLIV